MYNQYEDDITTYGFNLFNEAKGYFHWIKCFANVYIDQYFEKQTENCIFPGEGEENNRIINEIKNGIILC
jgi:hypothetical protein